MAAEPTVQAWTCAACDLDWAGTAVHSALSIIGLLPTPELRTAGLPGNPAHRGRPTLSQGTHQMTTVVSFPVDQVIEFEARASVNTTIWWCRLCGQEGTARTTPHATDDAIVHLGADHGGMRTP
jgi:ribosomal protein L37AE/L43A